MAILITNPSKTPLVAFVVKLSIDGKVSETVVRERSANHAKGYAAFEAQMANLGRRVEVLDAWPA